LLLTQAIQTQKVWEEVAYYITLIVLMVMAMDSLSGWLSLPALIVASIARVSALTITISARRPGFRQAEHPQIDQPPRRQCQRGDIVIKNQRVAQPIFDQTHRRAPRSARP
jgi:hypothetical protein